MEMKDQKLVVIIGGGLAGMSSAIEAFLSASKAASSNENIMVKLLDKEPRLGGNSAKASSGINGVGTKTQVQYGVTDSIDLFSADTVKSGKGLSNQVLVNKLVGDSKDAVEWLQSFFELDLDVLAQLGGHSAKRTHRRPDLPDGRPQPVGFGITSTLSKWLTSTSEKSNGRLSIEVNSKVKKILKDENGKVNGIVYTANGTDTEVTLPVSAIILATGGFGGESGDPEHSVFLKKYASDYLGLPTTNGQFATGDGIFLGQGVGADTVDLDQVQVHPTGFVSSKDPNSKTKFLAAEALRGEGGLLLNGLGKRFVNELGTRDAVTDSIWKHCSTHTTSANALHKDNNNQSLPNKFSASRAYLVLSKEAAKKFGGGALGFYAKMGLMNKSESLEDLASSIGVNVDVLRNELLKYELAKHSLIKDPFGKSVFPASVFDTEFTPKQLDSLSKALKSEEKLEKVLESQMSEFVDKDGKSSLLNGEYYWGVITPSIHYTMGGLKFNDKAQVLNQNGAAVSGLFAAGEVTGGLHGANRLGGNSLLECVVYGREAGRQSVSYASKL
ncbi:hypothetical protein BB559_006860 [Furculomyces boomerangus]|uniref:fumarate reductase (NADH) n=2 Tax=Harpellales TaxID=61421 RepID=A0A2T9Y094_9FUNG|nr:hypothetical protein BB559_006860 [Furculomyces boomerangus]PVZ96991.1 hypothetical protein BB558_007078 [Smittium angustum]